MRDYGKVTPSFWTGETGRFLRSKGAEVQVLALYLVTGPHADAIGLYYLAMPTLCHETGLSEQGASKGLKTLSEGGFAHYDAPTETVFVPEMAKYQIGAFLKPDDNRVKWVRSSIETHRKCPFYKDFYEKYGECYHLGEPSPSKPPTKPLRSHEHEHEHEHDQEQDDSCMEPEESVLDFETVGDTKSWSLTQTQVDDLASAYPGVDVMAEARKAKVWLNSNPTKRKTAKGMPRFLNGWLAREQDKPKSAPMKPIPQYVEPKSVVSQEQWDALEREEEEYRRQHPEECEAWRAKMRAEGRLIE